MSYDADKQALPPHSLERHRAAMAELLRMPGVVRVGLGLKEQGGQLLAQWAYRVYVARKRPLAEVPAGERIPSEWDGLRTDVLAGSLSDRQEQSSTPTIHPGERITRDIPNNTTATGTIGLLVRKPPDEFILTCQHVLMDDTFIIDEHTFDIYDPEKTSCNNPVATLKPTIRTGKKKDFELDGKRFFVDAGLAKILPGVKRANVSEDLGPLNKGIKDLSQGISTAVPPAIIRVRKRGGKTGLTQGKVAEFFDSSGRWEMRIKPDPGAPYDETFEVEADDLQISDALADFTGQSVKAENKGKKAGKTKLRLTGRVFSLPGDSGAPVVDDEGHIVGLLRAGFIARGLPEGVKLPTGDGAVGYIVAVLKAMDLKPESIIPPGGPAAGAEVAVQEAALEAHSLHEVQAALAESSAGRLLLEIGALHFTSIAQLVHHRRRVKVVWHRNMLHAFAAEALLSLREPERQVSEEIGGVRRSQALRSLCDALLMEGDEPLREMLRRHGDWVIALAESASSLPALVSRLAELEVPA